MKTTQIASWAAGLILATALAASAHGTPCCEEKPCPPGQTAVPGATPAAAQCCVNPDDPVNPRCTAAPNAGWRCMIFQNDPAGMVSAIPGRQAVAGCVDGEDGTCIGGASDAGGPEGCIGLGGLTYVTSSSPSGGSVSQCTADAVASCCAHSACEVAPAEEGE
jgi:hypothetical protein